MCQNYIIDNNKYPHVFVLFDYMINAQGWVVSH